MMIMMILVITDDVGDYDDDDDGANEPFHLKNLSSVRLVEGDPLFHLVRGENHNKYLFKLQNIFV